jgi:hypothetical protein
MMRNNASKHSFKIAIFDPSLMLMLMLMLILIPILIVCGGCANTGQTESRTGNQVAVKSLIKPQGSTIAKRFIVPEGYKRVAAGEHSFAGYLRTLPLKPHGTKVKYYNGETKSNDVYEAVVDLDTGNRNLQQCADSVIRLRAEYLFKEKKYENIHFNFTSGFKAEYAKWREGYRVVVLGNYVHWAKTAAYSTEYKDFRKYLDTVYSYAGTLSLAKELIPVKVEDMQIGDVFIQGGSPGHCEIVVDMAQNVQTGQRIFMLAQGYMPAQDIHILKNPDDTVMSPWYSINFGEELYTPQWVFKKGDLKRFSNE